MSDIQFALILKGVDLVASLIGNGEPARITAAAEALSDAVRASIPATSTATWDDLRAEAAAGVARAAARQERIDALGK